VYASDSPDGAYALIGSTRDTTFVETGLPSFARCYRVSAVDERGQEGDMSETVCNDNCPYYELPNVFTPNDDGFNDTFSSDFDRSADLAEGVVIRCPRFVRSVDFRVYNRLGKEVYSRISSGQGDMTIDWNGQSAQGEVLPPGVYYYIAHLSFDALAPERMSRELRGWVHLIR
jgi:gliding motility-associated-like protein